MSREKGRKSGQRGTKSRHGSLTKAGKVRLAVGRGHKTARRITLFPRLRYARIFKRRWMWEGGRLVQRIPSGQREIPRRV